MSCSSSNDKTDSVDATDTPSSNASTPDQVTSNDDTTHSTANNDTAFNLSSVGYQLIELLGGYSLILTSKQIETIAEVVKSTAINSVELEPEALMVTAQDESESVPFQRTQYICEQGGTLVTRHAIFIQSSASYSHTVTHTEYIFDQCAIATGGEQTLDGSMLLFDETVFDVSADTVDRVATWTDFSWKKTDGYSLQLNADIKLKNNETVTSSASREVTIADYALYANETLLESVDSGDFRLAIQATSDGETQGYSLSTNGLVSEKSAVPVQVKTEETMSRTLVSEGGDAASVPFTGRISMVAEDNSEFVIEATATVNNNTLQVDSTYTDAAGNVTTMQAQNFVDLTILAF